MAEPDAAFRHRLLKFGRTLACLSAACLGATVSFAFMYGTEFQGQSYFLTYILVLLPFTAAIALLVGGPSFWILRRLGVQRGILPCIVVGAALGSLPGLFMLGVQSEHTPWLDSEVRQYPLLFGSFGAIGGLCFWLAAVAMRLR